MSRLPTPGSDDGNWGDILNDYLEQAHKDDGTLKDDILTDAAIAPANIDGDAGTPSLRTLGNGAQQAYPGSAGAANAATIAALEASADSGLTTEIALLYMNTPSALSGVQVNVSLGLDQYVSVVPSWFTLGSSNTFTLSQPGLYLVTMSCDSNYTGFASWRFSGNGPNDDASDTYVTLNKVGTYAYVTASTYIVVFDDEHPYVNPNALPTMSLVHTNSEISATQINFFSGGGTGRCAANRVSITRVQSNPITL